MLQDMQKVTKHNILTESKWFKGIHMQFLLEIFPIIIFFVSYKVTGDIKTATASAIVATFIQVMWQRYKYGFFPKSPLISLILITVFGGATLIFHNEWFIKWKPSVLYWVLSIGLIYNQATSDTLWLQKIVKDSFNLPQNIWAKLNISWIIFFLLMGLGNIIVAYNFDTNFWVNYKLFGTIGITALFISLQALYISKNHVAPEEE